MYKLIHFRIAEEETPARLAASRPRIRPARHSSMSQILNSGSISSRLLILTLSLFQCVCYREHIILTTFSYSATEKSTSCRPPCMAFLPPPLPAAFSSSPLRGHRRVSHADGHAVFKVQQAKRKQKSRHKTDQPCLRFFWKVMLVGYVTAESQNVQPHWGFHCSAAQTRTFENTPLSAVCKKKRGKLWRKERGLDGASPPDKAFTDGEKDATIDRCFRSLCGLFQRAGSF